MRLDPVFDSFYLLGSLWGMASARVCPARPATAFIGVNVVPMDAERVLSNQTVLVESGRITALGPVAQVPVPAGAVRIDGRGKYLIPGISNMHIDGRDDSDESLMLNFLAGGITAIRPSGPVPLAALRQLRDPQRAEERPSPYFYLAGNLEEFVKPDLSPDSVAAAYKAAGYNVIFGASDSLLVALLRLGVPLAEHLHTGSFDYMRKIGARKGSIDHMYGFLTYEFLDSLHKGKADRSVVELQALAAEIRRVGIWVVPTLDCMEAFSRRLTPPSVRIHRQFVKAMQDSGVGLLLGSENSKAYRELAALVRAGLTPYQALRTGTYNPAQYLGLLNERGTLAVGKRADLVLLSGDPLQDIRHTLEPAGVMLAGRWFDRVELDRRLLASPNPKAGLSMVMQWAHIVWTPEADWPNDTLKLRHARVRQVNAHMQRLGILGDTLATAQPKSPEYERVLRLLAAELSAMRALLTKPEQYELFDSAVRVWLREQTRQGYRVAVSGVLVAP